MIDETTRDPTNKDPAQVRRVNTGMTKKTKRDKHLAGLCTYWRRKREDI